MMKRIEMFYSNKLSDIAADIDILIHVWPNKGLYFSIIISKPFGLLPFTFQVMHSPHLPNMF